MTRRSQIDHELAAVRALLSARDVKIADLREGEHGLEPDVIATKDDGTEVPVEVGRIMDEDAFARELRALRAQDALLQEFCRAYRKRGQEPPGVHVCVEFASSARLAVRKRVLDAVMRFVATGARPEDWVPIAPLPADVSQLEIKFSPMGAKAFTVPSAGAFFPALNRLIEDKSEQESSLCYADQGDVILLAVVPAIQPWMRGPWLDAAVERVRADRGNSPAPFREIVGLDETTGEILFTIP